MISSLFAGLMLKPVKAGEFSPGRPPQQIIVPIGLDNALQILLLTYRDRSPNSASQNSSHPGHTVIVANPKPSDSIAIGVIAIIDEEEQLESNEKHAFLVFSEIPSLEAEQGYWYKEQPFP